jgi:oligopeptide/dipeptide ABC transporter ATP-binding protein
LHPPSGCRFHPRCPRALEICAARVPDWKDYGGGHYAACWNPMEAA